MGSLPSTVLTIVFHTPIWVWPLYALLLLLGLQLTRDSVMPMWRKLILPLVVLALAAATLISSGLDALPSMTLGLVVGSAAGWRFQPAGATRRVPNGTIWVRGEWWSFAQIVLVLIYRYITSVVSAMSPTIDANPTWHFVIPLASAGLTGLFLGRLATRLHTYFAATAMA